MNVQSKVIEANKIALTITLSAEEFEVGLARAYDKIKDKVKAQGFRQGKMPRGMFEKQYGVESLYDDALNVVLPEAYEEALDQEGAEPVDYPTWEVEDVSKESGVVATATVWIKPTVTLGEYKGLKVEALSEEVTDADIDAEIERLAAQQAEMVLKEGAAVDGDTVVIDFEGFKEGEAFDGGKGENHPLVLGSNSFIPGFEEQLIGLAAGDEKDVEVTFPDDYHAAELAGAPVVFKVKVHEVKVRQLPEINDDFVLDLDQEGIETVDALKKEINERLAENKKIEAKNHIASSVIEQAVKNATFEVPEIMIEHQINQAVAGMEQQYSQQGLTLEMFLQFSGQTMESLREQLRPEAVTRVEQSLVIDAIVKKENFDVSEAEIEAECEAISEAHNLTVKEIKARADIALLEQEVRTQKTVDMMIDSAVVS